MSCTSRSGSSRCTRAGAEAIREYAPVAPPLDTGDVILLVHDEESVRRVVARQLEASGYPVLTTESGESALAIRRHDAVDSRDVGSDVCIPGMTGIERVFAMLAERIDRPVLLLSGQMDTQLPHRWPAGATVRFLPKPLRGMALRRADGATA